MEKLYSVKDAAEYLEVPNSTFKYRIWQTKEIVPDGYIGKNPYFTRQTLDNIRAGVEHPNVAPVIKPLGSIEAAEVMGITYAAFHHLALPPDGEIGNTKYYWPGTIRNQKKRRHYPFYTLQEAAEYLGVPWATMKHHLYTTRWLKPDNPEERVNLFSKETLDKFAKLYNSKRTLHTAQPGSEATVSG